MLLLFYDSYLCPSAKLEPSLLKKRLHSILVDKIVEARPHTIEYLCTIRLEKVREWKQKANYRRCVYKGQSDIGG